MKVTPLKPTVVTVETGMPEGDPMCALIQTTSLAPGAANLFHETAPIDVPAGVSTQVVSYTGKSMQAFAPVFPAESVPCTQTL